MKNNLNMYCNFQYLRKLLEYRQDEVFGTMFEAGHFQ